jgi:hypothetical protein
MWQRQSARVLSEQCSATAQAEGAAWFRGQPRCRVRVNPQSTGSFRITRIRQQDRPFQPRHQQTQASDQGVPYHALFVSTSCVQITGHTDPAENVSRKRTAELVLGFVVGAYAPGLGGLTRECCRDKQRCQHRIKKNSTARHPTTGRQRAGGSHCRLADPYVFRTDSFGDCKPPAADCGIHSLCARRVRCSN